jgi:maleamate amidohydrolase|tara:strand:- start:1413 stop:2033 length:621 start_codon:yes stop_codon:yes gene_type:complete
MTDHNLTANNLGLGTSPALLIVDMMNGFTDAACPLGVDCPEVVAANRTLLAAFRAAELPIFFTTVIYRDGGQASVFRHKIPDLNLLTANSKWVAIDSRLERRAGETLIEKCWPSAFFATDLDVQLRRRGVDSLVVTGLTTSGCVRASAVDALQYNYQVIVAEDAVGDRNQSAHRANLFDLAAKYASVQSAAEIASSLSQSATPAES